MGCCFIVEVELWGLFHGLHIDWEKGYRRIKMYSYSINALNLVTNDCVPQYPCCEHVCAIVNIYKDQGEIMELL